jgi:hypothetical protein
MDTTHLGLYSRDYPTRPIDIDLAPFHCSGLTRARETEGLDLEGGGEAGPTLIAINGSHESSHLLALVTAA